MRGALYVICQSKTARLTGMPHQTPIIWINDPFGLGKNRTAQALQERMVEGFLFDPEEMGLALKKLTPNFSGDPQNHPMWIPLMLDALQYAARESAGVPVIVPVAVWDIQRHRRLMSGLKDRGLEVHHFTLLLSVETVQARLRRGDQLDASQIHKKMLDFQGEAFATHIHADEKSANVLAEEIATLVGISLKPPQSDPLRWLKNLGRR